MVHFVTRGFPYPLEMTGVLTLTHSILQVFAKKVSVPSRGEWGFLRKSWKLLLKIATSFRPLSRWLGVLTWQSMVSHLKVFGFRTLSRWLGVLTHISNNIHVRIELSFRTLSRWLGGITKPSTSKEVTKWQFLSPPEVTRGYYWHMG